MSTVVAAVVVASLLSGAVFGASIRTPTEWKVRRGAPGWQPFNNSALVGIFLNQVFWLLCVAVVCTLVVVVPLRYLGAYPLSSSASQALAASWLAGAVAGKLLRYLYWRRRL